MTQFKNLSEKEKKRLYEIALTPPSTKYKAPIDNTKKISTPRKVTNEQPSKIKTSVYQAPIIENRFAMPTEKKVAGTPIYKDEINSSPNIFNETKRSEVFKPKKEITPEKIFDTVGGGIAYIPQGFLERTEGLVDFTRNRIGNIADFVGLKGIEKELYKQSAQNTTGLLLSPAKKLYDKNTIKEDSLGANVLKGAGGIAATVGMGGLGGNPILATGISGAGSGEQQALQSGATKGQAFVYGGLSGAVEAGTEALSGGIGGVFGKGAIDDIITDRIVKQIKSNTGKFVTNTLIKAGFEGAEENISGAIDPILKRMTYDPNAQSYFKDENGNFTLTKAGQDFLVGALTSALVQAPGTISNVATGQKYQSNELTNKRQELAKLEQTDTTKMDNKQFKKFVDEYEAKRTEVQKLTKTEQKDLQTKVGQGAIKQTPIMEAQLPEQKAVVQQEVQKQEVKKPEKVEEKKVIEPLLKKDVEVETKQTETQEATKTGTKIETKAEQTIEEATKGEGALKTKTVKENLENLNNAEFYDLEGINKVESFNEKYDAYVIEGSDKSKFLLSKEELISKIQNNEKNYNRYLENNNFKQEQIENDLKAKEIKENEQKEYNNIDGFRESDTNLKKGMAKKILNEKITLHKKIMTKKDWIKTELNDGRIPKTSKDKDSGKNNYYLEKNNTVKKLNKTEYEYAKYIYENKLFNEKTIVKPKPTETKKVEVEKPKIPLQKTEAKTETKAKPIEDLKQQPKVAKILAEKPKKIDKSVPESVSKFLYETENKGVYVDNLAKATKNKKLTEKYDNMFVAQAEGNYSIGEAQTNNEGKAIGKSLIEIWKPVNDSGKKAEFSDYLLHKHNIDRMALENNIKADLLVFEDEHPHLMFKERKGKLSKKAQEFYGNEIVRPFTEIEEIAKLKKSGKTSGDDYTDAMIDDAVEYVKLKNKADNVKNKPVFGETITEDISRKIVKDYETKNPEFKEWQKDVNKFFRNELQNLKDAGFIDNETQELLNNMYSNYVKIQRDYKQGGKPIGDMGGKLSIKTPIKKAKGGNADILPLDEVMAQTVMQNKSVIARNAFGQELYNTLGGMDTNDGDIVENLTKNKDGDYSFTVWVEGQKKTITLDEGLYNSIKPSEDFSPGILAPLRKLGEFQREVLTGKNPFFMARNFFRDMPDAVLNSKYGKDFPISYISALKQIATNGEMWKLYRAKGGEQNSYFDYKGGIKVPSKNPAKKFIRGIEQANIIIEQAPRLAEFISTLKNGGTVSEAMYNSAEITTNFKRGGVITKAANKNGALFLNASVQGLSKQVRNLTGQNGVKGYANLLIKASVLGIVPALLNDFLLGDDEDYENLPSTIKDNYYLFKTGDGKFIRIPKGRATGTLGAAARRVLENDFEEFGQTMATNLAPNNPLEQNVLAPLIQAAANKTWYGGEIVNQRLKNELPKNQFDETTDEFSKKLGEMTNISPKKINYVLNQYGGVLSDVLLPPLTKKAETGIIKSNFTTDAVLKNKNVGDFYKKLEKATQIKNDSKATEKDLLEYKFLNKVNAEANDFYKQKREIENSKLSDKEKKNQVRQLQREINEIFTNALQTKPKVESNYAEYGDFNFYKDKDNEWQSVDKEEFEKVSGFNKNEYFKEYSNISRIRDKDNGYETVEKKQKIVDSLLNSKLNDEEKSYLYGKYYTSDKKLNALAKTNIKFDYFLQLQKATAGLEALDDPKSDIEGKVLSGSKKKQYIQELQKLPTTRINKLVLMGFDYSLEDNEKTEVFNYVNKLQLSAAEKKEILKQMSSFKWYENGQLKGW